MNKYKEKDLTEDRLTLDCRFYDGLEGSKLIHHKINVSPADLKR